MKVNKDELLSVLTTLQTGLSEKGLIEQSTCIASTGGLLYTYNDEINVQVNHDLGFEGAVEALEFIKVIQRIKKQEITLTTEESNIIIKAGRIRASIALQNKILLPLLQTENQKWKKLPNNFTENLGWCSQVASADQSEPDLTCVFVNADRIVASDGYRFIITYLSADTKQNFLLPANIAKTLAQLKPTHINTRENEQGWVEFKTENEAVIACRIFEEQYPDFDHVLEFTDGIKITLPGDLPELLETAQIFSRQDFQTDEEVVISIKENKLSVASENERGNIRDSTSIKYKGEEIEFVISPYLLKDFVYDYKECQVNQEKLKITGENYVYIARLTSK